MNKNKLELSGGTLRQRRNLLLITVLLIFMEHGRVTFGTNVNIFGASASIGNPDFILQFLLLIQAYFLWRFYQYFNSDDAYSELKNQYRHNLMKKLDTSTLQQIFKGLPENQKSIGGNYSYSRLVNYDSNYFQVDVEIPRSVDSENERLSVKIPKAPIEIQRFPAMIGFVFRGRILTDFFLPYVLVGYSTYTYLV